MMLGNQEMKTGATRTELRVKLTRTLLLAPNETQSLEVSADKQV